MVPIECRATIGVVGNLDHELVNYGKARKNPSYGYQTYSTWFCHEP